eukprot:Nitzschia sp. Nitz4//scaffold266_size26515//5956//7768//NITZ4_008254-RA/size26515-augustus-gene-0.32-mRNA-1//-1//CDS//3329544859//6511//frame0
MFRPNQPLKAVQRLAHKSKVPSTSSRLYATSAEKRALNESQLKGKTPATPPPGTPAAGTPPTQPKSSGSSLPLLLVVAAAGGAGYAYYEGLIPGLSPHPDEVVEAKATKPAEAEAVANTDESKAEEESVPVVEVEQDSEPEPVAAVAVASKEEEQPAAPAPVEETKAAPAPEPTVDEALQELQTQLAQETSRSLTEAHAELAKLSSLDLSELDSMSPTQLKIRLVQLSKDLEDRTKWEAVRLKEFLAMKEKEVEDKHVALLKRQRLEAETNLEHKLHQQELELTTKAEKQMHEKELALQAIVDNSLKIQEQQFNEEKADFEKQAEAIIGAKYEEKFAQSVTEAKQAFAQKLQQKVQQIEALTKKLADLEFALHNTKTYQSGSVQAHRMSAAALSLIDKLESSKPAGAAVAALQAVAEDNSVVASAVAALPASVTTSGIATMQELQTSFEEQVHAKCRQAALVPVGQQGLEGQLLGMVFATLKFPPGPEDAAPESLKDDSEYILARARRHVQLGELEQAVGQMEKLKGQVGFVAKDWTQKAKDRVNVENALKVIRLECALANESMGKAPDQ